MFTANDWEKLRYTLIYVIRPYGIMEYKIDSVESNRIDPGAGSSHTCILISEELADTYIDETISGYSTPERKQKNV